MKKLQRTPEQIKEHYEIEKQLSQRLCSSTRRERQTLYTSLYDELFRRVPHHPQVVMKSFPQEASEKVAYELRNLEPFLKRNSTFLEIGSGAAALSLKAARLVRQVYAIDVSKEITRGLTFPPNFKFILSNGTSIPVPANSVDVAYSNQLMEHLHPEDALEQLQNIYKALSRGGIYICVTPNRFRGPHDISRYFDTVATGFHLKEYTITELDCLFKEVGFSKTKIYIRVRNMHIFLPVFLTRLCEKLLERLPGSLRRTIASSRPMALLLGIKLIGIK
jgi:SAM-dependent methyltransferase